MEDMDDNGTSSKVSDKVSKIVKEKIVENILKYIQD